MPTIIERAEGFFAGDAARPIDRARFAHHFQGAPLSDLLDALAVYQNDDGGFGNNLEVDIKAPQSNPFSTELAMTAMIWAKVPVTDPMVQAMVAYLERTQDADGGWSFVDEIYEHELAPWFQNWGFPDLNPACTTVGLMRQLGIKASGIYDRVDALFERLADPLDMLKDEFYAVRPYAFYFGSDWDHLDWDLYVGGMTWWLIRQHISESQDAHHWFQYIPTPETPAARSLPLEIVEAELDRLENEQSDDGGWPTPYDPGWRGWGSVENLLVLRAYGRI